MGAWSPVFKGGHMKKIMISLLAAMLLIPAVYSQAEEKKGGNEKTPIGLTFRLDYWSNYLGRVSYFYGRGGGDNSNGVFYPTVGWEIFGSGLSIGIGAELSDSYLFDGTKKTGWKNQSFDAGIDYFYTWEKIATLSFSCWYWYYFNYQNDKDTDISSLTPSVKVEFDVILKPFIKITYDIYPVIELYNEFYLQFGIGHGFDLTNGITFNLGLSAGFYHADSFDKLGITDIRASLGFAAKVGGASFNSNVNYVLVPNKDIYEGTDDMHRWYASIGAAYTL